MKKQIFMALLAAVSSFAMVSCGDDDKNNDPKPTGTTEKATYNETSSGCYVTFSHTEAEMGTSSTKVEWNWDNSGNVTEYKATVTCTSAAVARLSYEAYLSEKEEANEEGIKSVTQSGNNIYVEYEIDENIDTKDEAIFAAKAIAYANGAEGISMEDLIPTDFNVGDLDSDL